MAPIILIVIVVIATAAIYGAKVHRQKIAAAWAEAAQSLAMSVQHGSAFRNPEINGQVDGMRVKVDTYTRRSGNNSQTFTRYQVRYRSAGTDFELHRQTGFSTITKLFGAQDVEVGDQRFDDTFVIKSDHPDRIGSALTPTRRTAILGLASSFPGVKISDTRIQWEKRGVTTNSAQIVTIVRRLVGGAYIMADRNGAATGLDATLAARNEGDLEESTRRVREASGAFRELIEVRRMEAETLAEAGEPDAAQLLADLAKELPEDEEVRGWNERVAATSSRPAPPPVAAEAEPTSFDAGAMADDLFGESRLSFETSRRFDELYLGTVVRWSGRVRSSREYQRDQQLGETAGTRVVLTVARIENDLYGQTTVDAVVGLPPGNANSLRGQDELTFQGTLSGIDAMMRNFFVKDARLV